MDSAAFERLMNQIGQLSPEQYKQLVLAYATQNGESGKRAWDKSVAAGLEQQLVALEINRACPACGSIAVVNNGFTAAGVQRRHCQDCGATFTSFTGTMIERSRFPWEVWVETLRSTLNGNSLEITRNILENDFACDGMDIKTVFAMRHKLIHAMASVEPPKLSGVIQMDETFIRESQKGHNLELFSYIRDEKRRARYGRRPS